jgi:hypothetical protein
MSNLRTSASIRPLLLTLALLASGAAVAAPADVRGQCNASSSDEYYFPASTFADESGRDDSFVRGWYSEQLRAMAEPSLSCGTPGRVYRFTWLRSFHHPVVVRVTDFGNRGRLDAVELDGSGGDEPGSPLRRKSYVLGKKSMSRLRTAMAPAWDTPSTGPSNGRDGAEWILEVADAGRHHALVRWSPGDGLVRELGLRLLSLSGWKFHDYETY